MKDLQAVVDDLKDQATKRAAELMGEGRGQMRSAVGGHSDGALFGMLALGLVVGCLAGAAIALLYTPVSGVEARKRLGEQVEKVQKQRPGEMTPTNGSTRSTSTPASPYAASS
jgi:hypothetical protein